jgi:hypothetical protein
MLWPDDENHPFVGIAEKLKRSHESILNLHLEIGAFFEGGKYPVIPDANSKEWQEALDYHRDLTIPRRFSVLSGEIIHHLRTCLDHIVWHFSSSHYRIEAENAIEFPVFREEPLTKDKISRYERKVKGVTKPEILELIRKSQPYNRGGDPENDPICIVHDMDRFDKHRELVIVASRANLSFESMPRLEVARVLTKYSHGEPVTRAESVLAQEAVKKDAIVSPQIAFSQFGKRKDQLVVPVLLQLHEAIFKRIDLFEDLI